MDCFFFLSRSRSRPRVIITSLLLIVSRRAFFDSCARVQGNSGDTHSVARIPRYKGCGTPTDIADAPTRGGRRSRHFATPGYAGEYVKHAARVLGAMLPLPTFSTFIWVLCASTYTTDWLPRRYHSRPLANFHSFALPCIVSAYGHHPQPSLSLSHFLFSRDDDMRFWFILVRCRLDSSSTVRWE